MSSLDDSLVAEITPDDVQSVFVYPLPLAFGLAFDGGGNLYIGSTFGNITEITPGGAQTILPMEMDDTAGLAFDNAGDLFVADVTGNIVEISAGGGESSISVAPDIGPNGLAFEGETLPVPEPSIFGLLGLSSLTLFMAARRALRRLPQRGTARRPCFNSAAP